MSQPKHPQDCDCSICKAHRILTSEALSLEGKIRGLQDLQASLAPKPEQEPEGEKGFGEPSPPRIGADEIARLKGGDSYQRGWDDAISRVFKVLGEKFTRPVSDRREFNASDIGMTLKSDQKTLDDIRDMAAANAAKVGKLDTFRMD